MQRSSKGQIGFEYLIVSAAMLLVLMLLVVIFNGIYTQAALRAQYLEAKHVIGVIEASAYDVQQQGKGARVVTNVKIPPLVDLSRSYFDSSFANLYVDNFGDASAYFRVPINGTWPRQNGQVQMELYNNGTHVIIRPAGRLIINVTGIYINATNDTLTSTLIKLSNRANDTYALNYTISCPSSCACTCNGTNTTLATGSQLVWWFKTACNATKFKAGYLQINATPPAGTDLPSEERILPFTQRMD